MSLDFHVFCKQQPDPEGILRLLNPYDHGMVSGKRRFTWGASKDDICIAFDAAPSHYSRDFDIQELTDMLTEAKGRGYEIPSPLSRKFKEDGKTIAATFGIPASPDSAGFVADKRAYELLSSYPYLSDALPALSTEWGLTRFSGGNPMYKVELSTFIGAEEERISRMARMGLYMAKIYDGILYDPQKDSLGKPDVKAIVSSSTQFFERVFGLLQNADPERMVSLGR